MNRKRIHTIIEVGNTSDLPSRIYDYVLIAAVMFNIVIAVFDTFPASDGYHGLISIVETATVIFFTVDYVLRIWTADCLYPQLSRGRACIRFIFSWEGLVDFLSCIPFFIPAGGAVLRMLRIIRILRVFRIHHYADPLHIIGEVISKKKGQLLSSIFIILILMTSASLMMYNLEHDAQPDVFTNAFSGFWWAANTLLTVGYGDMVPVTIGGRICGIMLAFLGVFIVAIPTGILSAGFVEQVALTDQNPAPADAEEIGHSKEPLSASARDYDYCPYCGKRLP